MKKLFLGMLAAAMLLTVSCQNDIDLGTPAGESTSVSFVIGTPEIATRSYSDGQSATILQYAVYDAEGNELNGFTVTDAEIHGTATVNLQLTTGNKYSVLFWAAAPNAPYSVDLTNKTMTVDYNAAVSNDESRDAFYKYYTFTVTGPMSQSIELKRPFAQLNIGTNDYMASEKAGYLPVNSAVTVKNVYNTLNLANGAVSNETEVAFDYNAIPEDETFPVAGYDYLSMNYLLVAADKELVDIIFAYTDGTSEKTRTIGSVPVQCNHRTNIYGQLLTSNVDINIEIKPEFDKENLPEAEEEKLIIASQIGGTVTLTSDVTLSAPLVVGGVQTRAAAPGIVLELDLNGHTISYESDKAAHNAMITVNAGSKLIVKDSEGNGKISYTYTGAGDANFGWGSYAIASYGVLVVENGTIEILCNLNETSAKHMYSAIHMGGGSTVINGGNVINETYRSIRVNKGLLTINDGVMEGQVWMQAFSNDCSLSINGGSFAPSGIDGSSVFVTNNDYDVSLEVTAGTFETKIGCSDFTKNGVKGSVSGGVFAQINDNLLAEDFNAIENNGKFYVMPAEIDVVATNKEELKEALQNGENIFLGCDVIVPSNETESNGYGAVGINQLNGGVIDGGGNSIGVNKWDTWDSAINTTGGTIKNITVSSGMRGIFVSHNSSNSEKVILENVVIDGTIYTISCDQANYQGLDAYNSTFNGWTSYAKTLGNVTFTNCSFGEGQGYAFCRPFSSTVFTNCDFEEGYEIDPQAQVVFKNCRLNGILLTNENIADLVLSTVNVTVE